MAAVQGVEPERAKLYKNNLTMLAAAKSATMVDGLIAIRKKTSSKDDYLKAARQLVNTYNHYTAAEYNIMVHRVRVAKQLEKFQSERHIYPNIEWLPTRSATPDLVHKGYWHHIWAQDDPFWQNNFPGCRWGCKCSWRTTDAPVTDKSQVKPVPPSPGLEGNPYYTNEIISKSHPYYKNVEPHVTTLGVLTNPDDIAYIKMVDAAGNVYLEHYLCLFSNETANKRGFVSYLIDNGFRDVKLLPQIHTKEAELRNRYYGRRFNQLNPSKCPNAMVDGKTAEFREVSARNKFKQAKEAVQKSDILVMKIKDKITEAGIEKFGKKCIQQLRLKTLLLINNEKVFIFRK